MNRTDLTEWLARMVFGLAAFIHVLPFLGVLGRSMLERAYGVSLGEGNDLLILMQHRALLFGILAAACAAAAFYPVARWPVGLAALASTLGFVVIAMLYPHSASIARIMWVDVGAALLLLLWMGLSLMRR